MIVVIAAQVKSKSIHIEKATRNITFSYTFAFTKPKVTNFTSLGTIELLTTSFSDEIKILCFTRNVTVYRDT